MKLQKPLLIFSLFLTFKSFASKPLQAEALKKPVIISLGINCEPALMARSFNIREWAFPFDWIGSFSFELICQAIAEKFVHFLDERYLTYEEICIANSKYALKFYHDFPVVDSTHVSEEYENHGRIDPNFLAHLDKVKSKYKVRIDRFLSVLTGDRPVIFIRTHINPDQAKKFTTLIDTTYPSLSYRLVVVNEKNEHEYIWNLPKVVTFWPSERAYNYWFAENEWEKIFSYLGLRFEHINAKKYVQNYCQDNFYAIHKNCA